MKNILNQLSSTTLALVIKEIEEAQKIDLTSSSDRELYLLVQNDQSLYSLRKHKILFDVLKRTFTYTEQQLQVLKNELSIDQQEGDIN